MLLSKSETIADLGIAGKTGAAADVVTSRPQPVQYLPADADFFDEIGRTVIANLPNPPFDAENCDLFDLLEKGIVKGVLAKTGGNKQAASKMLNVYRPRLYGILKRHGLE